ncbi:tetratricopeptide repeat protein [Dyella jiangningensis]|uniref:Uncharacterized protein n=1 Tax=Dyella jiangningensis TaxID=1379159 RepID=A0A328NZY7_9GAMM|nr:tetratricopeptide repeat protein [Dyella jiangningensis]RAO75550.1 hypothetical protein CA260_15925 [Dyella jiangningensis]
MQYRLTYGLGIIALLAVTLLYWPVLHFNFVWDDWQSFHDTPWLTQGDQWKHYIFRDFNNWKYYFRPLGVGLFALQLRLFAGAPGPMHAVSLALHLIDVTLVGVLAWRCATLSRVNPGRYPWLAPLCMLIYGLHPALIETVAWIGCQFDLMLVLLVLLGLIANLGIQRPYPRAATTMTIFFLAACTKEAAISFPLLLVLFDWILFSGRKDQRFGASIGATLRRNWHTYMGIVVAGIAYLGFRHWALGSVTSNFSTTAAPSLARLREISTIYVHYLQVMIWPMSGMSPIHPYLHKEFLGPITLDALFSIVVTLGIVGGGLYLALRHKAPIGYILVAITAALLPVLHIIPVEFEFEMNLYHERYATMALAMACSMAPLLRRPARLSDHIPDRVARLTTAISVSLWIVFSIIGIRLVLPNWTNDVTLWRSALLLNPHDIQPKNNLLFIYMKNKDYAAARKFGDEVLADPAPCTPCMLKIALLALWQHEPDRAAIALERVRRSTEIIRNKSTLHTYYLLTGQLLMQQGQLKDAQGVLRAALALAPEDAETKEVLNSALASERQEIPTHQ